MRASILRHGIELVEGRRQMFELACCTFTSLFSPEEAASPASFDEQDQMTERGKLQLTLKVRAKVFFASFLKVQLHPSARSITTKRKKGGGKSSRSHMSLRASEQKKPFSLSLTFCNFLRPFSTLAPLIGRRRMPLTLLSPPLRALAPPEGREGVD